MSILFLFTGLLIFLIPETCYAWAPGTHLALGLEVISRYKELPFMVGQIINNYPKDFLYGSIAADIVFGKKFIDYKYHCHNWEVGIGILEAAVNDKQKSFCYGYLSHLAADTIAHNIYVPYKMITSFSLRLLKHAYWEVRYDELFSNPRVWEFTKSLSKESIKAHDKLLDRTVRDTLFSFKTNKVIFNTMIQIQNLNRWRTIITRYNKKSQWTIESQEIKHYHALSREAILSFLKEFRKSRFYHADPAGLLALKNAKEIRKQLQKFYKKKKVTSMQNEKLKKCIESELTGNLFSPQKEISWQDACV